MNLQYEAGRSWLKVRLTNTVLPAETSSLQVALSDGSLGPCLGDTLNSQDGGYKNCSPWGLRKILEDSICKARVTHKNELPRSCYKTLCGELDTLHPLCLMHWYEISMYLCDNVNSSRAWGSSLQMSLSNYSNRNMIQSHLRTYTHTHTHTLFETKLMHDFRVAVLCVCVCDNQSCVY